MKYAVNSEGVEIMKSTANSVQSSLEDIAGLTGRIRNSASEHSDCIGPHQASLEEVLEQIEQTVKFALEPANSVAEKLNEVAEAYDEIIANDVIRQSNSGNNNSEKSQGGIVGFVSKIFNSGSKTVQSSTKPQGTSFSGFETGKMENGTNVIKGDHFDQYISDYYNSEGTTFVRSEGVVIETISPSLIEGVHLDDRDINNPGVFWGMHNSSKDFFIETASHIPQVQAALESGKTIDELREDPTLGTCVSIYFNPEKMPRVEKNDGYYTFDSDGRHRIIAAREQGYNIPVRIIGRRHRNRG